MKLKDTTIKALKPSEKIVKLSDGASLFLVVHPTGTKTWIYAYRFEGKQKKLTLGKYPEIGLGDARKARQEASDLLKQGIDPSQQKKIKKQKIIEDSFRSIAEDWFSIFKIKKADKTIATYTRILNQHILPRIGDKPITEIKRLELVDLVKGNTLLKATRDRTQYKNKIPISIAIKICGCLALVFNYARNIGVLEYSVADKLSSVLPDPEYANHKTALKLEDVRELLQVIRMPGYAGKSVWYFLNIMPYVFVRNTELRCAQWEEFDLEKAEWNIPGARMKGKKADKQSTPPHFVPLSRQVVILLKELRDGSKSNYLFPAVNTNSKCITDVAPLVALKRFGFEQTIHGFRTIASTYLHEMNFPTQIIEAQMAHKDKNIIRSTYNKAEYKEERIKMMQVWADYLDELALK